MAGIISTLILILYMGFSSNMSPSYTLSKQTILKPEFTSSEFSFRAGTSFVLSYAEKTYLLTAHHLFGPAAGLDKRYSWDELKLLSPSVKGFVFDSDQVHIESGLFIPIENALGYNKGDPSQDLAVFQLPNNGIDTLSFANTAPSKGDKVYLYARLKKDSEKDTLFHSATITEANEKYIEYKYDNRFLDPRATSGAPILNQSGEVIGLNIAAAGFPIINWKGRGNSSISLRRLLDENIKR